MPISRHGNLYNNYTRKSSNEKWRKMHRKDEEFGKLFGKLFGRLFPQVGDYHHVVINIVIGRSPNMKINNINFDEDYIESMAKSWSIDELAVFGSILTDDFRPESDIDFLVTFNSAASFGLFEIAQLKMELENHFNRKVDLIEKPAISNPFRKKSILESARTLYVN